MSLEKMTKTQIGSVIPKGTSGSVLFIDSNKKLGQDNANLFWDDSNNRLGIGVAAPSAGLDARVSSGTAGRFISSTSGVQLRLSENSGFTNIDFSVNASTDLGIIGGNVGIGTTSPTYLLDLETTGTTLTHNLKTSAAAAAGNYGEIAFQTWSGAGSGLNTFGGAGTSRPSVVLRGLSEDNAARGAFVVATFSGGSDNVALTEKMRVTSAGLVGIGTASPSAKLDIHSSTASEEMIRLADSSASASVNKFINWESENGGGNDFPFARISSGYGDSFINSFLAISVADSSKTLQERMRIDVSGNVGIGTTSPAALLDVSNNGGSATPTILRISNTGGQALQIAEIDFGGFTGGVDNIIKSTLISGGANSDLSFWSDASTEAVTILGSNGNVGIGTASPAVLLHIEKDSSNGSVVEQMIIDGKTQNTVTLGSGQIIGFRALQDKYFGSVGGYSPGTDTGVGFWGGTNTGTPHLFVNDSGNVGIGTTTPATLLEIEDGNATTEFQISNTATDGDPALGFALSGVRQYTIGVDDGADDRLKFGTTAIGTGTFLSFDTSNIMVLPKASTNGIKVDIDTPTFGFADILGDQFSKNVGATKPTLTTYNGVVQSFQFGAGDEAYISYHIPHDYVKGTDLFLHIHWSHIGTLVTGGTVTFKATSVYAKGHNQAAFQSTPAVGTFTGTASTTQFQHILSEVQFSASTPTGIQVDTDLLEPDGVIEMTFELDANDITVSGGGVPDPFIHFVDLHYQTTGLIGTKDKVPDFYA